MEPATKQDLQEVKQELGERIDQVQRELREVKQELGEVKQDLLQRIDQSKQELRVEMLQRMDEHAASIEESIRDSQTEVLKAFLTYQEGQHIRMRGFENKDVEITQRMDVLESRLQEIERRLILNPPAA